MRLGLHAARLWHPRSRLRRGWTQLQIALLRQLGIRHLRKDRVKRIELDIGRFPYMGFGASLGWIQSAYVARDRLSAELSILNPDRWPFGGARRDGDLTRFIDFPQATIRYGQPDRTAVPMALGDWVDLSRWGYHDPLDSPTCLFGYLPAAFSSLDAYRSHCLRQLYRPSAFAASYLQDSTAFLPPQYVAWHVRRGDKTAGRWKEDEAVGLEVYVQQTLALREAGALSGDAVVLCTDSEEIVGTARAALQRALPDMELLIDPNEVRWNGYCALHRTGQITDSAVMVQEVLSAQKILDILRRAEYLIGCDSSCLFRTAALLRPDLDRVISLSDNKVWKKYYPI